MKHSKISKNMTKLVRLIIVSTISLLFVSCHIIFRGAFLIDDVEKDINENTKFRVLYQASDNTYYALFSSFHYGYYDYWIAHSKDGEEWKKYFTGEIIRDDYKVKLHVTSEYIEIVEPHAKNRKIVIPIERLTRDSDGDGLTDIAENRLCTDPDEIDTDDDGIPDNLDRNPLAGKKETLNDSQKLTKLEIEKFLDGSHLKEPSHRRTIIAAVEFEEDKMEFRSSSHVVLCLTHDEALNYLRTFGYNQMGAIKVTPRIKGNIAKVEFTIKRAPMNGSVYESTYRRNSEGEWVFVDSRLVSY